jgi:protein-S-isoprenylcysteine O-methyltransferase Ste14
VLLVVRVLVIGPEEEYLTGQFGAPYTDYCARVRRWL